MASAAKASTLPRIGQIWFLEEPRLGDASHGHYALVTQFRDSNLKVVINFIATDQRTHQDFRIEQSAEGFSTTGLKHTCHLLRDEVHAIAVSTLVKGKYKGFISDQLKKDIEEWWGESL